MLALCVDQYVEEIQSKNRRPGKGLCSIQGRNDDGFDYQGWREVLEGQCSCGSAAQCPPEECGEVEQHTEYRLVVGSHER